MKKSIMRLKKNLDYSDITATDFQDEIIGPIVMEE